MKLVICLCKLSEMKRKMTNNLTVYGFETYVDQKQSLKEMCAQNVKSTGNLLEEE